MFLGLWAGTAAPVALAQDVESGALVQESTLTPEEIHTLPSKKYNTNFFYGRVDELSRTEAMVPETDVAYFPQLGFKQTRITQKLRVHILSGVEQRTNLEMVNVYENQPRDLILAKGDKVILQQNTVDGEITDTMIIDFSRTTQKWIFIVLFCLAILLYGRKQGVSSLLSFVATLGILFLVFIPGIIADWNPVLLAFGSSILITFLVHFFCGGVFRQIYQLNQLMEMRSSKK